MLGEFVAWAEGKTIGQRSIPIEGQGTPRIGLSVELSGKLLGVDFSAVDKLLLIQRTEQGGNLCGRACRGENGGR